MITDVYLDIFFFMSKMLLVRKIQRAVRPYLWVPYSLRGLYNKADYEYWNAAMKIVKENVCFSFDLRNNGYM